MEDRLNIFRKIERTVFLGALLIVVVIVITLGVSTAISLFTAIVVAFFRWLANCGTYATFANWC